MNPRLRLISSGFYHNRRLVLGVFLIVLFLTLPWVTIRGNPAVLIDLLHGRIALFGLAFWAHDVPLLFLVLASLITAITLVTSIWGRVWCGWACPQTVFLNVVFRRIESSIFKIGLPDWLRLALQWSCFVLIALLLSHSFLAYFVGAERLWLFLQRSPLEQWPLFLAMCFFTGLILFDFGWFRERFCTVVCPYGRFQSVLTDERSLVVSYDQNRGEPRGAKRTSLAGGSVAPSVMGDCVDCKWCVNVCPTGIDIRNGLQMECVACTACMDACDAVMLKLNRPQKLIRYARAETVPIFRNIRFRIYTILLMIFSLALAFVLHSRKPINAMVVRAVGNPYEVIKRDADKAEPRVVNRFRIDLSNQTFQDLSARFELSEADRRDVRLVFPDLPTINSQKAIRSGESVQMPFFVEFSPSRLDFGRGVLAINIVSPSLQQSITIEVPLVGPLR